MTQPNENNVNPQDLLFMIGELTVENRLLRGQLAELKQKSEDQPVGLPADASAN